jgi:hypothetical protein
VSLGVLKTADGMRRRGFVTSVAAVCIAAALGACGGQGEEAGRRVSLLPTTAAPGTWEWTSTCRVGPHLPNGCAAAGPALGTAQLAGNEWNLGGGPETTGSVRMSTNSSGELDVRGTLSDAPPCTDPSCIAPEANTWVRGYPSVLYGIDQCHAATSPPQSPHLRLPMKVSSIPSNLIGSATYDSQASSVTYNIAYDLWLSPSGTKTPCQTDGTIEVMVWTDYGDRSLLPDSLKVGTATVPFAANGQADSGENAWTVYANNVYPDGHTVPWGGTIWLVLDAARTVRDGSATVDLSAALGAVGALLENNYGWKNFASSHWLDTIAFGTEFGPQSGDPYGSGPTPFTLSLTSYCLEAGTTVAAATC